MSHDYRSASFCVCPFCYGTGILQKNQACLPRLFLTYRTQVRTDRSPRALTDFLVKVATAVLFAVFSQYSLFFSTVMQSLTDVMSSRLFFGVCVFPRPRVQGSPASQVDIGHDSCCKRAVSSPAVRMMIDDGIVNSNVRFQRSVVNLFYTTCLSFLCVEFFATTGIKMHASFFP